jgi:hypothetical protein
MCYITGINEYPNCIRKAEEIYLDTQPSIIDLFAVVVCDTIITDLLTLLNKPVTSASLSVVST